MERPPLCFECLAGGQLAELLHAALLGGGEGEQRGGGLAVRWSCGLHAAGRLLPVAQLLLVAPHCSTQQLTEGCLDAACILWPAHNKVRHPAVLLAPPLGRRHRRRLRRSIAARPRVGNNHQGQRGWDETLQGAGRGRVASG